MDRLNSELKLIKLQLKMTEANLGDLMMIYEAAKDELTRRGFDNEDSN